jgi:hypothetical protein
MSKLIHATLELGSKIFVLQCNIEKYKEEIGYSTLGQYVNKTLLK